MGTQKSLAEAAADIFAGNVASKQGGQDKPKKLSGNVAYGTREVGDIGTKVVKPGDSGPDATRGVPTATPPGATPPVGSEPMKKLKGQPQEDEGRRDLEQDPTDGYDDYETIRDRKPGKKIPQTFKSNPGATFQSYGEEKEEVDASISEDIDAILSGQDGLSEDFKNKAAMVYEAAVNARVSSIVEQMQEEMQEQFTEAVDAVKEEFTDKLDDYLNYAVEEWMTENKLAVESGLRTELTNDFMTGLKNLFAEHYIDLPEEKVDVVEQLADEVAELEAKLNEQIEKNVSIKNALKEHKKMEVLHTVSEGLTQTQVEKLKSLAESVDYTTEEEMVEKLETFKESFFKTTPKSTVSNLNEGVEIIEEKVEGKKSTDSLVDAYAGALSKTFR